MTPEQMTPDRKGKGFHVTMALFAVMVAGPLTYMVNDRTPPFQLTIGTITPRTVRKPGGVIADAEAHIPPGARSAGGFAKLGVDLVDASGRRKPDAEIMDETIDALAKLPPSQRSIAAAQVGGVAMVTWKANFLRYNKPDITLFGFTFSTRICPGTTQRELIDSQQSLWPKLTRSRAGVFRPDPNNPATGIVTTPILQVPDQMATGEATYHVTNFYYCNSLQRMLNWPIVAGTPAATAQNIKFGISSR